MTNKEKEIVKGLNYPFYERGKRKDNGKWVEGFYVKHNSKHYIYTGGIQYLVYPAYTELPIKYEIAPETACRCTGVPDRNKRKIFEWDICEIHSPSISEEDGYFTVKWDSDTARFVLSGESVTVDFDNYYGHECEVIGNVFDNSDLIGD